jgi:hypothetical protein
MIKLFKAFWFIFVIYLLSGCCSTRLLQKRTKEVGRCTKDWVYKDLKHKDTVTVILYLTEWKHSMYFSAGMIIGVNNQDDTFAYTDYMHRGMIKKGKIVYVEPYNWGEYEKQYFKPGIIACTRKRKTLKLLCSFNEINYCRFDSILDE